MTTSDNDIWRLRRCFELLKEQPYLSWHWIGTYWKWLGHPYICYYSLWRRRKLLRNLKSWCFSYSNIWHWITHGTKGFPPGTEREWQENAKINIYNGWKRRVFWGSSMQSLQPQLPSHYCVWDSWNTKFAHCCTSLHLNFTIIHLKTCC